MDLPAVIDVAVGLVVLYLLLSMLSSFVVEMIATWRWWRPRLLYETIGRLITGAAHAPAPRAPWFLPWDRAARRFRAGAPGPPAPAAPPALEPFTDEILTAFWNHPMARSLAPEGRIPSYMEPATFAAIAMDLAVPGAADGTAPATAEGIERSLDLAVRSGHTWLKPLRERLLSLHRLRQVQQIAASPEEPPLAALRTGVARWYSEAMERLTGQYKRKANKALFWTGLVVATLLNGDTIRAIHVLSRDDALRAATSAYATTYLTAATATASVPPPPGPALPAVPSDAAAAEPGGVAPAPPVAPPNPATPPDAGASVASRTGADPALIALALTNELTVAALRVQLSQSLKDLQELQRLGFPLGWSSWPGDPSTHRLDFAPVPQPGAWACLLKLLGLLATAFAVSLGAPFWYDLLGKLVSLRAAGKPAGEPSAGIPPATKAAAPGTPPTPRLTALPSPTPPAAPDPTDCLPDLKVVSAGFHPRQAYWCAEAANLAYAAGASVRTATAAWGLGEPWMFDQTEAAQGFLAVAPDQSVALLAFRGTEHQLEDWKTDAAFEPLPSPAGPGRVHRGFAEALAQEYAALQAELGRRLAAHTLLYLTGHSLGGALATLMAARLAADKTPGVHSVITFGSPRVGDPAFAEAYHLALGHCTYRVVNGEDLVTRVPPRVVPLKDWRYDHVGQVVYFDSDGRMQMNAGYWVRFLNTAIHAVADFRRTSQAALADHAMAGYVRLLRAAISKTA